MQNSDRSLILLTFSLFQREWGVEEENHDIKNSDRRLNHGPVTKKTAFKFRRIPLVCVQIIDVKLIDMMNAYGVIIYTLEKKFLWVLIITCDVIKSHKMYSFTYCYIDVSQVYM